MRFDSLALVSLMTPTPFLSGEFTPILGDDIAIDPVEMIDRALDGEFDDDIADSLKIDLDGTPEEIGDVDDAADDESEDVEHEILGFAHRGSIVKRGSKPFESYDHKARSFWRGHGHAERDRTGPQWTKHKRFGAGGVRELRAMRRQRVDLD